VATRITFVDRICQQLWTVAKVDLDILCDAAPLTPHNSPSSSPHCYSRRMSGLMKALSSSWQQLTMFLVVSNERNDSL